MRHLDPEPKEVHDVGMGSTPKTLRCRIGIHRWQTLKNPETKEPYVSCERCHKEVVAGAERGTDQLAGRVLLGGTRPPPRS